MYYATKTKGTIQETKRKPEDHKGEKAKIEN
jgi:hypothetical protein